MLGVILPGFNQVLNSPGNGHVTQFPWHVNEIPEVIRFRIGFIRIVRLSHTYVMEAEESENPVKSDSHPPSTREQLLHQGLFFGAQFGDRPGMFGDLIFCAIQNHRNALLFKNQDCHPRNCHLVLPDREYRESTTSVFADHQVPHA